MKNAAAESTLREPTSQMPRGGRDDDDDNDDGAVSGQVAPTE